MAKHKSFVGHAAVVSVIEVMTYRGIGSDDDPRREIIEYWSPDGKLLAVNDPIESGRANYPLTNQPLVR